MKGEHLYYHQIGQYKGKNLSRRINDIRKWTIPTKGNINK